MNIEELQEKLDGVYDLSNTVDCQSVIGMLLRDNDLERQKVELAGRMARMLADKVKADDPEVKELAERIIQAEPKPKHNVVAFLERMCRSMDNAEGWSDEQLVHEAIGVWAAYNMDSKESSVLDELIHRFKKVKGIDGNQVPSVRQTADGVHQ